MKLYRLVTYRDAVPEKFRGKPDRPQAMTLHDKDAYIALCGCFAEDDEKGNVDE